MVFCQLYVSDCVVAPESIDDALTEIIKLSRKRNSNLGVTGALIYSGAHFAQFLEGPETSVRAIMNSILCDRRHKRVTILLEKSDAAPKFSDWSLAYSGPSTFLSGKLEALRTSSRPDLVENAVAEVVSIMREFAAE